MIPLVARFRVPENGDVQEKDFAFNDHEYYVSENNFFNVLTDLLYDEYGEDFRLLSVQRKTSPPNS
jgi:hypothetical protein